jgi:hypothetical protein
MALLAAGVTSASAATPLPFGHACIAEHEVRFCPTASLRERVPSWDGAPMDVDVTLPASGRPPFPTIVMLHGYTYDKTQFESSSATGSNEYTNHYNNVWFAKHGFAVANESVRGVGGSCGSVRTRMNMPGCAEVEFELGDQRYDARDVQYLLGLLVDEGIANPKELGVTGISLGSLETLELAVLKNRIRLLNGTFAPWVSPKRAPLSIAAVYPAWAIDDLLDVVAPDGRFVDFKPSTATIDRTPVGVLHASFVSLAAASLPLLTWSVPPTPTSLDLPADLTYGLRVPPDDPRLAQILDSFGTYHQTIGMPVASTAAPILMEDGWDDSIVDGAVQQLRLMDYLHQVAPRSNIAFQIADVGHGISANKPADVARLNEQATSFFDYYLKGEGKPPAPGSVTAYTATCPESAPSVGPFTAPSWAALDRGAVRFGSSSPQTISTGGDPIIGRMIDPVASSEAHCATFSVTDYPGTAVYTRRVTKTFTMLGLPTMRMKVDAIGRYGQIDARLWDVGPDGRESFVSRGTYALNPSQRGTITWQLFGGGYTFRAGHRIRLELLASDVPYLRPEAEPVAVTVSDVTVELPSHEPPDGGDIVKPEFKLAPAAAMHAAAGCKPASGSLGGTMLGPVRLGMTRPLVRGLFSSVSKRSRRDMDVFCLAAGAIDVGFPSTKLLARLSAAQGARVRGRAVLALTASPHYGLGGVRPGTLLASAARRLHLGRGLRIGPKIWYLPRQGASHGVLEVRHGEVEQVGIADGQLTSSRKAARLFLETSS